VGLALFDVVGSEEALAIQIAQIDRVKIDDMDLLEASKTRFLGSSQPIPPAPTMGTRASTTRWPSAL
jgi:hypothetical protein